MDAKKIAETIRIHLQPVGEEGRLPPYVGFHRDFIAEVANSIEFLSTSAALGVAAESYIQKYAEAIRDEQPLTEFMPCEDLEFDEYNCAECKIADFCRLRAGQGGAE